MGKLTQSEIPQWLNESIYHALDLNYSIEEIASILQVSKKEIQKIQDSRCCSEESLKFQPPSFKPSKESE